MQVIQSISDLRVALAAERQINLVPTMGNLHEGHVSLVQLARQRKGVVVVSIFVNPLQFAPHEDFAEYPRTVARDLKLLLNCGCDIVFAPEAREVYPGTQEFTVRPSAALGDTLEGASRPGFFVGVSTVVLKLFGMVQPSAAVFGKKDYQQLLVVDNMVRQFALPIEILAGETIREESGLALSSRNGYLSPPQRIEAATLSACLRELADQVREGNRDWQSMESTAFDSLASRGWHPDYVAIRRRSDLGQPVETEPLVVLAAARLGATRLIDNLEI